MKGIIKFLSPLFLLFLWTLANGIYAFTYDPGEEGWGHIAAMIFCLFSIPPLLIDFLIKRLVKDVKLNYAIQLPVAVVIAFFYVKWQILEF